VNRLSSLLEETSTDCFAWALVPNHFHLLVRSNKQALGAFMRRLLTGYAVNFNHRHKRSGHLFQNRYKSIVCDEETYFLELVRYIHLNPLRARQVVDHIALGSYPWSGHAVLMGNSELIGQNTDEVLVRFGKRVSLARRHYQQFIEDGLGMGKRPDLVGGGLRRSQKGAGESGSDWSYDDRILGGSDFVDDLCREQILQERLYPNLSLSDLRDKIAGLFEVAPEGIQWRSRNNSVSKARAVFCYAAVRNLGATGVEVGEMLHMKRSAVSQALRRAELILHENSSVKSRIEDILADK
ncbi:MAG: transposase, partial [Desulfobulbaceae bacterium]|nr:transposase [Desulfobulbaceae bacterium]